ncbi:MFS transporter [Malacoplasma iowae]|uniref:Permease, major facilitator superfamily n=2 Tax=Malacoplasma iowae TaxID=2116 RepID=A0A084U3J7_MALIO|nr:permease, major facilitator superfamily [Malacoplasma iowae DK-CPA]WPL36988.1 MFS transporter [Malacoplasma iowae]WPL40545.1 MFS transporter [Malacoplasma iowae]
MIMQNNLLEITINSIIFVIVFSCSLLFVFKLKNVTKGYKIFFISYVVFWIPLKLLRDYTSIIQNEINPHIVWLPLVMYGLVGIFIRPIADWLSLYIKNRKIILYMAVSIGIITFIPIIIYPSTETNIVQSVGVGIGASMIGTYELMFKEQYTKSKSFLTVSIMAFPPLIADFISAPIQSTIKIISSNTNQTLNLNIFIYLWVVGIVFYVITFIILFFVKEDRSKIGTTLNNIQLSGDKNKSSIKSIFLFVLVCLTGFFISFIKFSNSGSIATLTIQNLAQNMGIKDKIASIQAYLSTIFSLAQLLGTVFVANFLVKKTNKLISFSVGISLWILFQLIVIFNQNPYVYFGVSFFNGFAYGILYNLVLAYVLSMSFKTNKITPMGIYQSILSIGIASSSFLIPFLKDVLKNNQGYLIVNYALLGSIVLLELIFATAYIFDIQIFKNKMIIKKEAL